MGGPTSSYATAGIALRVSGALKPHHHDKVGTHRWGFYCLRFGTSLFVASYDSQGHGGGIRPRLHTGH
jgi:hypothetical protein